jgi:hypothetical protein
VSGSTYWEIGYRGDPAAVSHATLGFAPSNSVLSSAVYGGSSNHTGLPMFGSQYCNGSRSPVEAAGALGIPADWAVPPGTNETNAFPSLVFNLTPSAVVDEGNNWVNLRWGPLSLYPIDGSNAPSYQGANPLANYIPQTGSSAINSGSAGLTFGGGAVTVAAPTKDFYGNTRPMGGAYDIGAVEAVIVQTFTASVSPTSLTFSGVVGTATPAQTVTVTNTGNTALAAGTFNITGATQYTRATNAQGGPGTCVAALAVGASCTINVVFTATANGPAPAGSLAVAYTGATITGSPVALNGTGVPATRTATVTPTTLAFGSQPVTTGGTVLSDAMTVTVTNTGNVALAGGTFTLGGGTPQPFARAGATQGGGGTCTANLAVGASCTYSVTFSPKSASAFSRTLTVAYTTATVTGPTVTLTGTGVAPTAGTLSFTSATGGTVSNTILGRTLTFSTRGGTAVLTVTNTGSAALTITAETVTSLVGSFTLNTGGTCAIGSSLAPTTGTCTFNLTAPGGSVGGGQLTVVNTGTTANAALALVSP